jgi:LPS-assembly protein
MFMAAPSFIMALLLWLGILTVFPYTGFPTTAIQSSENQPDAEATSRIILQAETLEYFHLEKRIVAAGQVVIISGKTRLFADHVDLSTESGVGVASGQVRWLTPDDDVRAARLDFALTTGRGVFHDASGVVAQSYVVSGERIERLEGQSVLLQEGRVTTCTAPLPDWEFRAREAHIDLGSYVTLKHPSFWIRGVPVFYVPYFILPIKEKRTTGFLPPRVGVSHQDGAIVGTEFYWAITDWMDTTLGVEYLSAKGWRPSGEFRYAIDPLSDGQVTGSFIHRQDTGEDLWKVLIQQRQEFGWGVRGLSHIDLRSERDIDRQFAEDIALESVVQTTSFGSLTKLFADASLTVSGEIDEAIRDSGNGEIFRRLPSLHFVQFPTSLFGGAFFAVEASYSRLSDTEILGDVAVQRLDLFPHVTVPLPLAPWMHLTFTGGVRETLYDHQTMESAGVSRELFDFRVHLQGPSVWRRYGGVGSLGALIHLIETRLAYRYVPAVPQRDIPPFETLDEEQHLLDPLETQTLIDRIAATNYAKVSLVHRLYTLGSGQSDRVSIQEVLRLVMSQGVDIRAATEEGGRLFGPLDFELDFSLWQRWWFVSTVRLEVTSGELQELNWRLGYTVWPGWKVHVGNRYRQAPDIQYYFGGIQVELGEGLRVGYDWRFDGLSGTFREHQATLHYRAQCWGIAMRFRWRESGDTEFTLHADLLQF